MGGTAPAGYLDVVDAVLRDRGPEWVVAHYHELSPELREIAWFGAHQALMPAQRALMPIRLRRGPSRGVPPLSEDPSVRAAQLLRAAGSWRRGWAEAELVRIARACPELPVPRLALAIAFASRKARAGVAVEHAAGVAAEHPHSDLARLVLAYCLERAGRHAEVLRTLEGLSPAARRWPYAFHLELFAAMNAGDVDRAVAAYRARNAAVGWRSLPVLAQIWLAHRRRMACCIAGLVVAWVAAGVIGVGPDWAGRVLPALIAAPIAVAASVAFHVTRSRRVLLRELLIALVWMFVAWRS